MLFNFVDLLLSCFCLIALLVGVFCIYYFFVLKEEGKKKFGLINDLFKDLEKSLNQEKKSVKPAPQSKPNVEDAEFREVEK